MVTSKDRIEAMQNTHASMPEQPPATGNARRRKVFSILGIVGIVVAIAALILWLLFAGREETDDAYIDGHISNVSSRVSGTVLKVFADDNQRVHAGQPLADLDPADYKVRVDECVAALEEAKHQADAARSKVEQSSLSSEGTTTQATADVSTTEAQLEFARSAVRQAAADVQQAQMKVAEQEAQVRFADGDYERYKAVFNDRVVTRQQFDKAKEACDIAKAQLQEAHQNLQAAKDRESESQAQLSEKAAQVKKSQGGMTSALATTRQKAVDAAQYESALATVKKAEADLEQAKLNLSYCHIVAPVDGRIGRKNCEVGQRVDQGQLLMALVQDHPWVTANYKETQIGKMHRGQRVEIKIDTFGDKTFTGRVDSISPASGAKFSMLPPDNATGNFTKVVQRVPLKVVLDEASVKPFKDRIVPGLSCVVTVITKN